ncbi:MAG: hypothetical protein Q9212_005500 [Teloschistes hypoglaucus]
MAVGKTLLSTSRCATCRITLLKAFTTSVRPPLQPLPLVKPTFSPVGKTLSLSRSFSGHINLQSELVNWRSPVGAVERPEETPQIDSAEGENHEIESQPWYLQVQTPRSENRTISDRQRLPDLPPEPPPLLQPMLQHISVDLGLDDLSLLDLREIDPPPALGANLLMIIGTARSEKHLHVSADRFCRWLRTTYKLRPYADGLLGRGELRIKLKRKNRRARMLNSVGAPDSSNTDDGIRTGWVCVNIGEIEDGRTTEYENVDQKDDGYVGFGGDSSGVKVVVQMLTEGKREDLDLETLWGQALARYTRRRDRIAKARQEDNPVSETFSVAPESGDTSPDLSLAP